MMCSHTHYGAILPKQNPVTDPTPGNPTASQEEASSTPAPASPIGDAITCGCANRAQPVQLYLVALDRPTSLQCFPGVTDRTVCSNLFSHFLTLIFFFVFLDFFPILIHPYKKLKCYRCFCECIIESQNSPIIPFPTPPYTELSTFNNLISPFFGTYFDLTVLLYYNQNWIIL